jgi:hypothetical protein
MEALASVMAATQALHPLTDDPFDHVASGCDLTRIAAAPLRELSLSTPTERSEPQRIRIVRTSIPAASTRRRDRGLWDAWAERAQAVTKTSRTFDRPAGERRAV